MTTLPADTSLNKPHKVDFVDERQRETQKRGETREPREEKCVCTRNSIFSSCRRYLHASIRFMSSLPFSPLLDEFLIALTLVFHFTKSACSMSEVDIELQKTIVTSWVFYSRSSDFGHRGNLSKLIVLRAFSKTRFMPSTDVRINFSTSQCC